VSLDLVDLCVAPRGGAPLFPPLSTGVEPGIVTTVMGPSGIGKSTLLLQGAARFAAAGLPTIYVSGEEAAAQVRLRAARLGLAGAVDLPGPTSRPGAWIEAGDILVLPSRYEGFPNVVAEATVSGMPVVAFDCPWGPRELISDARNGLLVPPCDVGALARAMSRLAGDATLRARMRAARALNLDRLSAPAVMRRWDDVIWSAATPVRLAPAV